MQKNKIAVILAVMSAIITIAIIVQIKTIKSVNSPVMQIIANDNLRNDVIMWKNKYDLNEKELEKLEKKLEKVRQQAVKNDKSSEEKESKIKTYTNILGLTNKTGSGVIVNITTSKLDESTKEYLDNIINELKNAGAESISINNNRMILTSAISFDGNVIKVNSEKIESPFIIEAIGDSNLLHGALTRPGGYIELLNSNGIKTQVIKANNIEVEKYNGLIEFKNIKTVI